MEIARTDFPIVGYYNSFNNQYTLIECRDTLCNSALLTRTIIQVSSNANPRSFTMSLGKIGLPEISYSVFGGDIHFIRCKNLSCTRQELDRVLYQTSFLNVYNLYLSNEV
jgi:hypothetical protein